MKRLGVITGGLIAVVIVGQLLLSMVDVAETPVAPSPPTTTAAPPNTPQSDDYPLREHANYQTSITLAEDMITRHRSRPRYEDRVYHQAFLYLITDKIGALRFSGSIVASEVEHEAFIDEFREEIHALEERYLAGEAFGTPVRIERRDGTVFEYDGGPPAR